MSRISNPALNAPSAIDVILRGNCIEVLGSLPDKSIDVIFADPPYNLQLERTLWRPDATRVNGVKERWDQFANFSEYDRFTADWLSACRRVLKDTGTIWVIGSYHNIFRVGRILQDLEFWILNDIVWIKNNPMPNFRGVRFTNAHETMIWAQKIKGRRYTFNYQSMKTLNHSDGEGVEVQMRSDWKIPLCVGKERIRIDGKKAHPTQKPEALLERVILASTNLGEVILDPFFGTGTTGAVARRLNRHWIGIETEQSYIDIARQRIDAVQPPSETAENMKAGPKPRERRIPFNALLANGYLKEGQILYFGHKGTHQAIIQADGRLRYGDFSGSIHQVGSEILQAPCNGWLAWYYIDVKSGNRQPIDLLRQNLRVKMDVKDSMEARFGDERL